MARRKRRGTQEGEYSDPLKDYNAKDYEDELVRALCEDHVTELETTPFLGVQASTTIEQTMRLMAERDIACLLVLEGDRLLGIFSERDVLNSVAERYEQIRSHPVSEIMTPNPVAAYGSDSPAKALNLMAVGGFRHVPILDVDENVVGILGPRRVTAYLQRWLNPA